VYRRCDPIAVAAIVFFSMPVLVFHTHSSETAPGWVRHGSGGQRHRLLRIVTTCTPASVFSRCSSSLPGATNGCRDRSHCDSGNCPLTKLWLSVLLLQVETHSDMHCQWHLEPASVTTRIPSSRRRPAVTVFEPSPGLLARPE
jgi:hypothetical protein